LGETHHTVYCNDFAENDAFERLVVDNRKQKRQPYLIKFFVVILGVRTPPPRIDAPVTKIPLDIVS